MAMYLPPDCIFARFSTWDRESTLRSRSRFWSLRNQYSHTLNSVGSTVVNILEYLTFMIEKASDFREARTLLLYVSYIFLCCILFSVSNWHAVQSAS
jgi:hypothetical protein